MEYLELYHGTNILYDKPSWNELDGEQSGLLYGKAMYFTFNKEEARDWAPEGRVDKYKLPLDGVNVKWVKDYGRDMYETIISMTVKEDCEYDVVILPIETIDGFAEALFDVIIMGEGTEEEIQEMCEIAESGLIDFGDEVIEFEIPEEVSYEILIRNEETLNKLIKIY